MPGSNRRLPRTLRNTMPPMMGGYGSEISSNRYAPLGAAVPTVPALEQPAAPKHFPFPNTPVDDDLFFESLMFVFTLVAGGLQFVHLYRTVWWLPHSYTRQALVCIICDFFNYNNVIFRIFILLTRIW